MRVIAGTAGRRTLKAPRGMGVRPTSDRVKEALFNILGGVVPESDFLDLFSGTGSIGIEALSRGARWSVFVEKDPRNASLIRENLKSTGLARAAQVICRDVRDAMAFLGKRGYKFDIVFLDPPYQKGFEVVTLAGIARNGLLKPGGLVVAESSKRGELPRSLEGLKMIRQERYGDTLLTFYQSTDTWEGSGLAKGDLPG